MLSYQYLKIGRQGFCLQQNPAILAWWLYFKGKPFGFGKKGARRFLGDMRRLFGLVRTLVRYQLHVPSDSSVMELEVHGNLCQQVHNGYKVFDLHRNVVVKVFSPEIGLATVRSEIERVRNVGRYGFAPSVRRWSVEERWYEEDYVNGYQAEFSDWKTFLRTFRQWLAPLVESMILASPPQLVNAIGIRVKRQTSWWERKVNYLMADWMQIRSA